MQRTLLTLTLPLFLAACSGRSPVTEADLQHHHWNLTSIDGEAVNTELKSDLEIGEDFQVNGLAGCNRFFGAAQLDNGQITAPNLATTMMACIDDAQRVETAVLKTLGAGAKVVNHGQRLELIGQEHTLVYQLADWM